MRKISGLALPMNLPAKVATGRSKTYALRAGGRRGYPRDGMLWGMMDRKEVRHFRLFASKLKR